MTKPRAVFVESLKGGVGKTIISINLAKQISNLGYSVALIDADIDSANFKDVVPLESQVDTTEDFKFSPAEWDGIKVFSMSLLTDERKVVSMGGDRYGRIINDAVVESRWGDIDWWIIDCPAGASDIWKTLIRVFKDMIIGSIVITQPASRTDAERVLRLHSINEVPVIGLLENMSYFECGDCGTEYDIFGESTVEEIAKKFNVPILGKLPLSYEVKERIENGNPIFPGDMLELLREIAEKIKDMEVKEIGFLERAKEKLEGVTRDQVMKIMGNLLKWSNRIFDLEEYSGRFGFEGGRYINFIITDGEGGEELVGSQIIFEDGALKWVRKPKEPDAEIIADVQTYARILMNEKKVGEERIHYDAWDAYLNEDAQVLGTGMTPWAIGILRVFESPEITDKVRKEYGSLFERML